VNLAVIPARGGSKRVPRKNVRPFAGKPVIVWSIEAAIAAGAFEHVIVSTDDQEIADVARAAGASVPFLRPAELADDHTGTRPVMRHAVTAFAELHGLPDTVLCLYPAAPFVTAAHLREAVALLAERADVDVVMPVAEFPSTIWRALGIDDGRLKRHFPEHGAARSQDLPPAYYDAGQWYLARGPVWTGSERRFVTGALPLVVPPHLAHDINTPADWERAERDFLARREEDRP